MLRKLVNSFVLKKNILRKISHSFSQNPSPNQNNQQPQKTPDIDPPSIQPPQNPQKQDGKKIRSQARMFFCRSELNKTAKTQVEYEKFNANQKQMEKVQNSLQIYGIKIKNIIDQGPLIEFHRSQEIIRKSQKKQKQSQKGQDSSQNIPEEQEDVKFEYKIYTRPFTQLSEKETQEIELFYATPEDFISQIGKQADKLRKTTKKDTNSNTSFKQFKNFYDMIEDLYKGKQYNFQPNDATEETKRFKEFSLYMRDARKQGTKWAKFELIVESWTSIHFYRISIVDNAEQDAKKIQRQGNKYLGPQARQLSKQLLQLLKLYLQSVQEIDPMSFLGIYYYTGLREYELYKKWLDDLVEFSK